MRRVSRPLQPPAPLNVQYRAEVNADGSVSLIADTPVVSISIVQPRNPNVTTIPLTSEEYQHYQTISAPSDMKLVHQDGAITAVPMESIS